MPNACSPASYSPAASLARGSSTLDPVIPGGRVGAGVGDTWPIAVIAKHAHKNTDAVTSEKGKFRIRFIILLLRLFVLPGFDESEGSCLATIDVSCKLNFAFRPHSFEGVRSRRPLRKNNTSCPNPHGRTAPRLRSLAARFLLNRSTSIIRANRSTGKRKAKSLRRSKKRCPEHCARARAN